MAATLSARLHAHFAPLHDAPTPDADLLARFALHGDAGAFAALVGRHGGMVSAVCRKRLGHAQDAEDAAQAVFLALARKASRVHEAAPVAAWLYGAAVRACREVARRNRRKPWVPLSADVPGDSPPSADHEAVAAVLDEVANLSATHRAAVVLCELEGCPRALAARRLGIAEGTLSSRLAAARRRLAEQLARRGFAPSALAVLAGLAVGGPSFAFDLPSVTPLVQRITEAIVTTSVAWKLKLCAALSVATATVGLAFASGDEPKASPALTPIAAKAAGKKFYLARVGPERWETEEPTPPQPTLRVTAIGEEGVADPAVVTDFTPALAAFRAAEAKEANAGTVLFPSDAYVNAVSPDGRSVVFGACNPPDSRWELVRVMQTGTMKTFLACADGRAVSLSDWESGRAAHAWAPDGRLYSSAQNRRGFVTTTPPFVFKSTGYATEFVDATSGRRQALTLPDGGRLVAVSQDGQSVLHQMTRESYLMPEESSLWLTRLPVPGVALRGADSRILGDWSPKGGVAGYLNDAAFSPDGRFAIVARLEMKPYPSDVLDPKFRRDPKRPPLGPMRSYELVNLTAGTRTRIATQPVCMPDYGRGVVWSSDGKRIAFTDAKGWDNGESFKRMQVVEPCVVTCDPDGRNPSRTPLPVPGWEPFRGLGHGPQLIGWR